jgi:phospholipase/carboxylesterase
MTKMLRQEWAGLDVVVGGGADGEGGGDGPLLVLLHGFGAPAEDLVPLAFHMDLPPGTRFVCPGAPLALGMPFSDARAWWMIDLARLERIGGDAWVRETPAGMDAARTKIIALLGECQRRLGAAPERTVIGGFSQGAMLATDVVLGTDTPFAGLVVFSGTLVAEPAWSARMPARRGLPVFQSHGTQDSLLPYVLAERMRMMWEDAGADVTFVGFPGGHEIPRPAVSGAERFLGQVLG